MVRALALPLSLFVVLAGCALPAADVDPAAAGDLPLPVGQVAKSLAVDLTRWSGEPSILALADGTLLITGAGGLSRYAEDPTDIPGNAGQSYLWRSTDAGDTWTFIDLGLPDPLAALLPYRNAIAGVEGDLAQDEAGRAYFVDMTGVATNGLSASDDSGATWTAVQTPVVGRPVTDRPWVAAFGEGVVYVKYLNQGHRVARSTDGGETFPEDVALPGCGQGALVADPSASEVLVPCADDEALFFLRAADGPMAWEEVPVLTAAGPPDDVFVVMAVARNGQYVFTWSERVADGARVQLTTSSDRGATWSAPVTVSTADRAGVFPWVDANADGAVSVVWYEADAWGEPEAIEGEWRAMHARFQLAEDGALSAPAVSVLSQDPIHLGPICTDGTACVLDGRAEQRRLLDFFEVDVDAAGTAHVAWTSTTTEFPTIWYGQVR